MLDQLVCLQIRGFKKKKKKKHAYQSSAHPFRYIWLRIILAGLVLFINLELNDGKLTAMGLTSSCLSKHEAFSYIY